MCLNVSILGSLKKFMVHLRMHLYQQILHGMVLHALYKQSD